MASTRTSLLAEPKAAPEREHHKGVAWYLLGSGLVVALVLSFAWGDAKRAMQETLGPNAWLRAGALALPADIDFAQFIGPVQEQIKEQTTGVRAAILEDPADEARPQELLPDSTFRMSWREKAREGVGLHTTEDGRRVADRVHVVLPGPWFRADEDEPDTSEEREALAYRSIERVLAPAARKLPELFASIKAGGDQGPAWVMLSVDLETLQDRFRGEEVELWTEVFDTLRAEKRERLGEREDPSGVDPERRSEPAVGADAFVYLGYPGEDIGDRYVPSEAHWVRPHLLAREAGTEAPRSKWTQTYTDPGKAGTPVITYSVPLLYQGELIGVLGVDFDTNRVSEHLYEGWPLILNLVLMTVLCAVGWGLVESFREWDRFRFLIVSLILIHALYVYLVIDWAYPSTSRPWQLAGIALDTLLSLSSSAALAVAALTCFDGNDKGTWVWRGISRLTARLNRQGPLFEGFYAAVSLGVASSAVSVLLYLTRGDAADTERELFDAVAGFLAILLFGWYFTRWIKQMWSNLAVVAVALFFIAYALAQLPYGPEATGTGPQFWWALFIGKALTFGPAMLAIYFWGSAETDKRTRLLGRLAHFYGSFARLGLDRAAGPRGTREYRFVVAGEGSHYIAFCERHFAALMAWEEGRDYEEFGRDFLLPDGERWTLPRVFAEGEHDRLRSKLRSRRPIDGDRILNDFQTTLLSGNGEEIPAEVDVIAWEESRGENEKPVAASIGLITVRGTGAASAAELRVRRNLGESVQDPELEKGGKARKGKRKKDE